MIAAPVFIYLLTALLLILCERQRLLARFFSFTGSVMAFVFSLLILHSVLEGGPLRLQFGNWQQPFGISFSVDLLSASLLVLTTLLGLLGLLSSGAVLPKKLAARGFYPLFHLMMAGVLGAFSTGDLFNLYVWFEVLLIASFFIVLLLKNQRSLEGGFKYAVLNILSSFLFLLGISLVYAGSGTLDIQTLVSEFAHRSEISVTLTLGLLFLSLAFLIKASVFPFFFWMPAAYPETFTTAVAVFAGLLTKVGLYALLRVVLPFSQNLELFLRLLSMLALFSMVIGVLGAFSQNNIKSILSFHSVSQVGFICLCFSLGSTFGVAAGIFYLFHHMIVKSNLFFSAAYIEQRGQGLRVTGLGSLLDQDFFFALLFVISALSLIGIPPFSGFWAKVFTLQALLKSQDILGVFVCLIVSLFTLLSMLKIWLGAFLKPLKTPSPSPQLSANRRRWLWVPLLCLNLGTVLMGLNSGFIFEYSKQIAEEVLQKRSLP